MVGKIRASIPLNSQSKSTNAPAYNYKTKIVVSVHYKPN